MKITKSELKTMISEALREELCKQKLYEDTQKSWYVLAVDFDPEDQEEIDINELEFYRWGIEQDVGYEIASYEDLIARGDKQLTLDGAKDRAREVINMTYADEVYIIRVTEDGSGNVIHAEYVTSVN
jgi:hypothetical protein